MKYNRRTFLQAAAAAGVATGTKLFGAPYVLAERSPNAKLRTAVIGVWNQGKGSVRAAAKEQLVALVDVDDANLAKGMKMVAEDCPDTKVSGLKTFCDYRKMFDQMHKQIDAVFICTPDHHHATAAMIAMSLGKAVYVEKPMAHSIDEVRRMTAAARKYRVVTQLGNQGQSGEGIRRLCEYIWAGAIGNVLETYSWAPTGRGGVGGRLPTKPVPHGLHWEQWIGPAAYRDYHGELHPGAWRSWWEFGDASIGDWGCHNLDGPFMALKLGTPTTVEVLVQDGGSQERYPLRNVIRWNFPARGDLPPVKVHWYDGHTKEFDHPVKDKHGKPVAETFIRPPLVAELEKKYGRDFGDGGTLYVGDKGVMYSDNYARSARIVPEEAHRQFPVPPKQLPRVKGTHQADFLRACKDGHTPSSHFDYSGPLSEMVLLGCLAIKAGVGQPVEWDAANMKCANLPELDRIVTRKYRPGWELA